MYIMKAFSLMQKYVVRTLIVALTVALVPLSFSSEVYAAPKSANLPMTCDRSKGVYKEMSTLVVIPLDSMFTRMPGQSPEDAAKAIFYDLVYARGNKASPFNAVSIDGDIYHLSCEFIDYTANIETGLKQGTFILGVSGQVKTAEIQSLIDTYKFTSFLQASMAKNTAENATATLALANVKECVAPCKGLNVAKDGPTSRSYKLAVSDVEFSKSVRQREQAALSLKVKNESEFPIYNVGTNRVKLQTTSSGTSDLYYSTWLAPNIVAMNTEVLLPGAEMTFSTTLGAPLLPGKYFENFQVQVGNFKLEKPITVEFTVEKDNLKLGQIKSKDGAAFANLREGPSLTANILGRLDVGVYVVIKEYQDAWVKVETKEGKTGWVYKPSIKEL